MNANRGVVYDVCAEVEGELKRARVGKCVWRGTVIKRGLYDLESSQAQKRNIEREG